MSYVNNAHTGVNDVMSLQRSTVSVNRSQVNEMKRNNNWKWNNIILMGSLQSVRKL